MDLEVIKMRRQPLRVILVYENSTAIRATSCALVVDTLSRLALHPITPRFTEYLFEYCRGITNRTTAYNHNECATDPDDFDKAYLQVIALAD